MNSHPPTPIGRVVLLGFMCSGKSTVGDALARRLEWDFLDFDVEIERREKRSVAEIIAAEGEDYFRGLESRLTEEMAGARGLVAAPGGGWITQPHLLEAIRQGTLSVWLRVSPEETARRLMADPVERPLKADPDPAGRVAAMLEEREPLYRLADLYLSAEGRSVESVAFQIEVVVRTRAGIES